MGTYYNIKFSGKKNQYDSSQGKILQNAYLKLVEIDKLMSHYKEDSEVSRFNRLNRNRNFQLSQNTFTVIEKALQFYKMTDRNFDITVGAFVNAWGFGPDQLNKYSIPSQKTIELLNPQVSSDDIILDFKNLMIQKKQDNIKIDLSGIAKGYSVDYVADYLESQNIHNYFVDVGGEIKAKGMKSPQQNWSVVIERPSVEKINAQRVMDLKNLAIATSGGFRNFYSHDKKIYTHTINPQTKKPLSNHMKSITVLHEKCMDADAWATALNVMGIERARQMAKKYDLAILYVVRHMNGEWETFMSKKFFSYTVSSSEFKYPLKGDNNLES